MRRRERYRLGRRTVWFWVFVAVVVILLLGLLFGGYRKGTRVDSDVTGVSGMPVAAALSS